MNHPRHCDPDAFSPPTSARPSPQPFTASTKPRHDRTQKRLSGDDTAGATSPGPPHHPRKTAKGSSTAIRPSPSRTSCGPSASASPRTTTTPPPPPCPPNLPSPRAQTSRPPAPRASRGPSPSGSSSGSRSWCATATCCAQTSGRRYRTNGSRGSSCWRRTRSSTRSDSRCLLSSTCRTCACTCCASGAGRRSLRGSMWASLTGRPRRSARRIKVRAPSP
ncbi:hypothetical protein C8R47DRAFT_1166948 [Mycena vitilis]|nr:hypothetical protein C8R47DRAFT_1166948 [Mycena vitilis]